MGGGLAHERSAAIVALADGGVVEVGSHGQLMAAKGFGHDRCMSRFRSGGQRPPAVVAVHHQAHRGACPAR